MQKPYWVIEHPTRGVYVGHECYGNGPNWNIPRPRFRWSINRNKGVVFSSPEAAYYVWSKFDQSLNNQTYVLQLGNANHRAVVVYGRR